MFKATDRQTGGTVAVKVLPLLDTDSEELANIQKEIGFLATCDHPNVVKYKVGRMWHGLGFRGKMRVGGPMGLVKGCCTLLIKFILDCIRLNPVSFLLRRMV